MVGFLQLRLLYDKQQHFISIYRFKSWFSLNFVNLLAFTVLDFYTMKKLVLALFILSAFVLNAQDVVDSKKLLIQYEEKLDLTEYQTSKFTLILEKHNVELYKNDIDSKTFNKLNKLRDLEFYKLLDSEQFEKYKQVKLEIEPSLKFRFN
jgi:hypothetical protein